MRIPLFALLLAALLLALPSTVFAHGGSYRPPVGEVPPGQRDPHDPQPPPENPGPYTPRDGGGSVTDPTDPGTDATPPADAPTPRTGPIGNGPGPLNPRRPGVRSGDSRGRPPLTFESWLFWWGNNRNSIIERVAAARAKRIEASPLSSGHFFGQGGDRNRRPIETPGRRVIDREVVPALERIAADRNAHADIRGGALIALARCGDPDRHIPLFLRLADPARNEDRLVMESAVLAIGINGRMTEAARRFLIRLNDDLDAPYRLRCFAAFSIGLLRDTSDEAYACLTRRLDKRESMLDLPVSSLVAIGLLGDERRVPDLLERLKNPKLRDLVQAHMIAALGKIGSPKALPAIEKNLRRSASALVRRSSAIAMGQVGPKAAPEEQAAVIRRLTSYIEAESDSTARSFALISIGRMAGHEGVSTKLFTQAIAFLRARFADGDRHTMRPFAALSLGLACFDPEGSGRVPEETKYAVSTDLYRELKTMKGDKLSLAALALSLGLVGDKSDKTVALLTATVENERADVRFRGASALALGLMDAHQAKAVLRRVLRAREERKLRIDAAVATGLLGDAEAVVPLVDVLNDPKASQFQLGSVALALGQIRDVRALRPLLAILLPEENTESYPDLTRALVAVALGHLARRDGLESLTRISEDVNYRATVSALEEVLTIL